MTKRRIAVSAAAVLSVTLLGGCGGGGDGSAYCNRVQDGIKNKTLEKLDPSNPQDLQTFIDEAKKLQADAPADLKDDYAEVVKAFQDPANASAKVSTAIDNIQKYDESTCDVTYTNPSNN